MMIVSVATESVCNKIREKFLPSMGIYHYFYDNNQSEVTLVPISKNRTLSQFDVVEGSAIQAIASKAGIIRTENAFEGIFKGVGRL
jgi:lipoprotein-releasing system permease protein